MFCCGGGAGRVLDIYRRSLQDVLRRFFLLCYSVCTIVSIVSCLKATTTNKRQFLTASSSSKQSVLQKKREKKRHQGGGETGKGLGGYYGSIITRSVVGGEEVRQSVSVYEYQKSKEKKLCFKYSFFLL